jgi:hypothetical protein
MSGTSAAADLPGGISFPACPINLIDTGPSFFTLEK